MTTASAPRRAKFGDFVADFDSFELRKRGIRLKLQDQPFQILKLLLQRPGQLVTREELRMELWTESTFVDFDAGLNAAIRRLRDALNDSADEPRYIETLPRHGYRFMAPVDLETGPASRLSVEIPAASSDGRSNEQQQVAELTERGSARANESARAWAVPWPWRLVAACLLVMGVAMGALAVRSRVFARHSGDGRVYSIAVLPLQNLSGDPSQDYFADGMTDALITNLAQIKALHVISSTSSSRYKGTQKRLPEIGRELNVGVIVEGSAIRSGNHLRISVQLIDAAKDQHLWARHYDRDVKDVLQLQSELASAVATEVAGRLTQAEESRLTPKAREINPQAYEALLKGHYFLEKWTVEGFEKAKTYFQQSIELDPSYADAYAGLAEYYGTMAFMGMAPRQEAWPKAEELLAKTLEMDRTSSKAHSLLGIIKFQFRCDRAAAEKELNLALELNPSDMYALDWHSYYLLEIGRTDEAITEKRIVLQHDPLRVITNSEMGIYLYQAGRYDEAISQEQKTVELDPNYAAAHARLAEAYEKKGQYPEALAEYQKAISLEMKPARLMHLGVVYARWGKRQKALETIKELQEMSKQRYVSPTGIALIYTLLGVHNSAIVWLQKAKADDEPKISDPEFPEFESLRSDPRFKALEARLKPDSACPPF